MYQNPASADLLACIGTPNCSKWKIIFRCPKIWAHYSLIIMCLNIGTPKNHHFSCGTYVKVVVLVYLSTLGVPILKHFRCPSTSALEVSQYLSTLGVPILKHFRCPNT